VADDTLAVQAALVAALRADAGVQALVGQRVYDQAPRDAATPFVSLGPALGQPFEAQGLDAWEAVFTLDVWSRAPGGVEVRAIQAALFAALHHAALSVAGKALVWCRVADSRDVSEDGGELRHGITRVETMTHA